ncbi:MAG TPA: hypothetical protein VK021_01840 [Flavobacteriaceae bacterium]|nr:hypothetical protein [Flavobacteriaceae bacterium]
MEINWFTVIAQIINFLILVWLLKRFLYKPVLNAIDEREKKIASRLADAATKKVEAKREQELFRKKNEVFDRERSAKMQKVHDQANSEKQRLFDEARKEFTALRSKLKTSFKEKEQEIMDKLKKKTRDTVFAITGKTLSDLANADLEKQILNVFIKKIENLNETDKTKFTNALKDNDAPIIVKSVFELSATSRQELEKAIEEIIGKQSDFQYLRKSKLVSGIELEVASYQLSWNIESYLDLLKKDSITKEKENAID